MVPLFLSSFELRPSLNAPFVLHISYLMFPFPLSVSTVHSIASFSRKAKLQSASFQASLIYQGAY